MAEMIASALVKAGVSGATAAGVSTAMTVASAGLSVMQGISAANQASASAQFEAYKAGVQQISVEADAAERAKSNVDALRDTLAQNRAAFASRGIDISGGTAGTFQEESLIDTSKQLKIIRSNAGMQKAALEVDKNAAITIGRMRSRASLLSGFTSAADTLATTATRRAQRGDEPTSTEPGP